MLWRWGAEAGFLCCLGVRPLSRYPGKAPRGNPMGCCGCREFGVSVGCSTQRPFPLFKWGEEDGEGEERGRRDAHTDLLANSKDALQRQSSHHPSQGPESGDPSWIRIQEPGLCPSHFTPAARAEGAGRTPWMDALFVNHHPKVFQEAESKWDPRAHGICREQGLVPLQARCQHCNGTRPLCRESKMTLSPLSASPRAFLVSELVHSGPHGSCSM